MPISETDMDSFNTSFFLITFLSSCSFSHGISNYPLNEPSVALKILANKHPFPSMSFSAHSKSSLSPGLAASVTGCHCGSTESFVETASNYTCIYSFFIIIMGLHSCSGHSQCEFYHKLNIYKYSGLRIISAFRGKYSIKLLKLFPF